MWILDNFKPVGRLQRGEYFLRLMVLTVQLAFWLLQVVASGIGAAAEGFSPRSTMVHAFYLMLGFGLLIAWQSFALMLRRLHDIGINPVFAVAFYVLFWISEVLYFSTVPELTLTVYDVPMPISSLGVGIPALCGFALLLLPSAPENSGPGCIDNASSPGTSWADAIKIPAVQSATSADLSAERRSKPRTAGSAKPQFGNRPARQP